MRIVLVRHGKTDWGRDKRISGWSDPVLNEDGIAESRTLLAKLSRETFDVIVSSPLKRACQTAEIFREQLNLPLVQDEDIRERHFGTLEGLTWEDVKAKLGPDIREKDRAQLFDYREFGGESAAQVQERLTRFVDSLRGGRWKKPLVVTHSGIIRMLHLLHDRSSVADVEHEAVYALDI